ncbi:MAG TPA: hypothetical protein VE690_17735 [Rhodopila sp.]|nr:hypothetical protein [Rhodopila sp.]
MLEALPMPDLSASDRRFLADAAATLTRHPASSVPLRRDTLRARVDALVARRYGLTQDHYARVLGGFNHRSWPEAPTSCLHAFDAQAHQDDPAPRAEQQARTPARRRALTRG